MATLREKKSLSKKQQDKGITAARIADLSIEVPMEAKTELFSEGHLKTQ